MITFAELAFTALLSFIVGAGVTIVIMTLLEQLLEE